MKIIIAENNNIRNNKTTDGTFYNSNEVPTISLKPDSALLKDGKPFFIPDFSERITMAFGPVLRSSRLGKNIAERFAYRYYDAMTVGIDMRADDLKQRYSENGTAQDLSSAFDYSAVTGEFVEIDANRQNLYEATFRLLIDGQETAQCRMADMIFTPEKIISHVSRFMTMKIGDLIYAGAYHETFQAKIGQHIEGFIDDRKVLDFNIR